MAHPFEARPDREAEATQLLQEVWDSERDSDGDLCIYLDEFGDNDLLFSEFDAYISYEDFTNGVLRIVSRSAAV